MTVVPLLRAANAQIEAYMAEHAPGADGKQDCPPPGPEELRELNRCLAQIGARMEELQRLRDTATEPELARYVDNLEGLRTSLMQAEESLKAKRDALRQRRDMVQKAMAWTQSYKQML
jgi:chromosome segregation ATPase